MNQLAVLEAGAQAPLPDVEVWKERLRALNDKFGFGEWSDALENEYPSPELAWHWD